MARSNSASSTAASSACSSERGELRVPDEAFVPPALLAEHGADRRVEELGLDRHVRGEVARQLREERFANAGAPALNGFAELLQVPVMTLEKSRRFHDRGGL